MALRFGRASMTFRVTVVLDLHAKQIDAIKRFDELILAQSALHGGDGESVIAQRLGCVGMDVFQ